MKKNKLKNILIILIGIVIVCVFIFFIIPTRETFVNIPVGSNPKQVAKMLKSEKLILNEDIFLTLVWLTKTEKKFKPGMYKLDNRMFDAGILSNIVKGNTYKIKVTIPEGFNSAEIAQLLEKKGICNGEKFLEITRKEKMEGYLFPETYYLNPNSSAEEVARILNNQYKKIFDADFLKRVKELKMSEEKIIILASIIEKEAKKNKERPLISSVFHNRIKKGWNLESCATVIYALGKHKDFLTYKDIKIKSPYNTYIHSGFPPGPICNPGLASIKAALYPAVTKDMFFVADGSGTHKFSKYVEEHNKKKKEKVRG
ncbi:MAG: hypothetical protein A2474_00055 [Elusimicrobia bacterium RIFOXYC2_FULL_34_12]|nr:MAG: hypothetical protein A2474_00055 [Elusimicrobia bacterium RIFOXYC2_FULL_34_12]